MRNSLNVKWKKRKRGKINEEVDRTFSVIRLKISCLRMFFFNCFAFFPDWMYSTTWSTICIRRHTHGSELILLVFMLDGF